MNCNCCTQCNNPNPCDSALAMAGCDEICDCDGYEDGAEWVDSSGECNRGLPFMISVPRGPVNDFYLAGAVIEEVNCFDCGELLDNCRCDDENR